MSDENLLEISDEAFSSREREIAAFFGIAMEPASPDETGSAARIERIMSRATSAGPSAEGAARIGRILKRISEHAGSAASE